MPEPKRAEPEASRPHMPPQYGILEPTKGGGLLPWGWATERLAKSRTYWIATTQPDGRPHAVPVWGVWLEKFYFSTAARSRKGRNLAANPRCVVCTERTDEAVIVEGVAEEVIDPALVRRFKDAYKAKYQEDVDTSLFGLNAVRPRIAFAFVSDPDEWAGSATRWRFGDD